MTEFGAVYEAEFDLVTLKASRKSTDSKFISWAYW